MSAVASCRCRLTISLSGRPPQFNKRHERKIAQRSRRNLIAYHGRSKRWLEANGFIRIASPTIVSRG